MESYGVLSLVPLVLSIGLAIYTRNIILSLVFGALIGTFILAEFNPFFAVSDLIEKFIFLELMKAANVQVLVAVLAIGGFIQLLDKSGGAGTFSAIVLKFISTPVKAQFFAWFAGISVFFTDVGNALIVGPLFRPVFRQFKICREKLAYILDTTAAPVTILVPFSGWAVFITGLIENTYTEVGLEDDSFSVLLSVWPYQFYALLALLSVPMILSTGKDFGPMISAQASYNQALKEGSAEDETSIPSPVETTDARSGKLRVSLVILPLSVLLVTMTVYILYFALEEGMKSVHVRGALTASYALASVACAYLMKRYQKTTYKESINHFVRGMEKLMLICLVLVLAWSLGSICKALHTGDYLAHFISDKIDPNFLPLIVFFLGALMSFATGSSYGTFAILMIIVVPVAHTLGAPMILTIAAVLSGGLFGDHTSPISDTTVLASMGAGCAHINHVSTQFTYATITGGLTMIAFAIAGFYQSPYIVLAMIALQFFVIRGIMKISGHHSAG